MQALRAASRARHVGVHGERNARRDTGVSRAMKATEAGTDAAFERKQAATIQELECFVGEARAHGQLPHAPSCR